MPGQKKERSSNRENIDKTDAKTVFKVRKQRKKACVFAWKRLKE